MDNDEPETSEPSSSHIYEHLSDSNEDYLAQEGSSSIRIDSSEDFESFSNLNEDIQVSDIENEDLQSNYYENAYLDQNTNKSFDSNKAELPEPMPDAEIPDHIIDELEVQGSQPGCSSSSGSANNDGFHFLENKKIKSSSEMTLGSKTDSGSSLAQSSNDDEFLSKPADSNCLEKFKGKGKNSIYKEKVFKLSLAMQSSNDADNGISCENPRLVVLESPVQSSNRHSLFAKVDSKSKVCTLKVKKSKTYYDSDSSIDDLDIIDSQPSHTSSPNSKDPQSSFRNMPSVSCFLNDDESFMVASSSEEVGQMNDMLQVQSPTTPGDLCLVSSSTGQLDSLPPTPLNYQENDASHSSLSSSPVLPPVLDSTVDSTSGQMINSPYSVASDEEVEAETLEADINISNLDERNQISTSVSHVSLHQAESNNDNLELPSLNISHVNNTCQDNHSDSSFISQFLSIDNIHSHLVDDDQKEQSDGETSEFIPTSSDYITESIEIPGTSGISDANNVSYFARAEETYEASPLSFVPESVGIDSVPFEVDTSMVTDSSTSSANQVRLLELDLSGVEPESSNVVASSASFDEEEFPSRTEENTLNHTVGNFQSASTLTQLNQHYNLGIGECSLSGNEDSNLESTGDINNSSLQVAIRECIEDESDIDEGSSNFQASLELGLGPQQLRDFSGRQCGPQSLVPPPHLLDEAHQMETSNIDFQSCDAEEINGSPSVSLSNCIPLTDKILSYSSNTSVDVEKSSVPAGFMNTVSLHEEDYSLLRNARENTSFEEIQMKKGVIRDECQVISFQKTDFSQSTSSSKETISNNSSNLDCDKDTVHLKILDSNKLNTLDELLQSAKKITCKQNSASSSSQEASLHYCDTSYKNIPVNIHSLFGNKSNKIVKPTSWSLDLPQTDQFKKNSKKSTNSALTKSSSKTFDSVFSKNSSSISSEIAKEKEILIKINASCSKLSNLCLLNNNMEEPFQEDSVAQCGEQLSDDIPNSIFFEDSSSPFIINVNTSDQASVVDRTLAQSLNLEQLNNYSPNEESRFWCSDCEKFLRTKCSIHRVQTIMDKPILSRAWASLPVQHLLIKQVSEENNDCSHGVFARKFIPKRTQFGPLEGVFCQEKPIQFCLMFQCMQNQTVGFIDISDEGSSNWMRFVRPANTYIEMNCIVIEEDEAIYYHTTANILPKTELRVGYSKQYAIKYSLSALAPSKEEQKILEMLRKTWSCYECDDCFETSPELQNHLATHDKERIEKRPRKRGRGKRSNQNDESPLNLSHSKKIKVDEKSGNGEEGSVSKKTSPARKTIFQCLECPLCFNNKELLRYHSLYHKVELAAPYKNEASTTENRNVEKDAEDGNNSEADQITCPVCPLKFPSIQEIGKHIKKYSFILTKSKATQQNQFKCELCYKSFCSQERLDSHAEAHKNESDKPYPCYLCMRRFCNKSALGSHSKLHTEEKESVKVYDCPICREKLLTVHELKLHFPKHCVDGCYTCPTCKKNFPSYFQIRRHIRSYHSDQRFTCADCGKDLPSYQKLVIHMAIHSDRREFGCPVCPKRFKRKDKMKEHLKRLHTHKKETNKSHKFVPKMNPNDYKKFMYKCDQCLLGFKRRGMLVNHFSKRHPDIPISSIPELNQPILQTCRTYYCHYCEKPYRSATKRNIHIFKNHPGQELVPHCQVDEVNAKPVTKKTFAASCPWCPRQYMTKAKLLQHQRSSHPRLVQLSKDKKIGEKQSMPSTESQHLSGRVEAPSVVSAQQPHVQAVNYKHGEDELMGTFENFKQSNKEHIKEISEDMLNLEVNYNKPKSKHIKDDQLNHQSLQLSNPVLMNVSNAPLLIESSYVTPCEDTQPYVILTPDGLDTYTLSLRHGFLPGTIIGNYSVLSEKGKETHPSANNLDEAGTSHDQRTPLDMRSSRSRNMNTIEGSSTQITVSSPPTEEGTPPFSIDLDGVKNDMLTCGGDPSLVVCQPFLSFTSSTL